MKNVTWEALETLTDAAWRFGFGFGDGPRAACRLRVGPPRFPELLLACQLGAGTNHGFPVETLNGPEEVAAWRAQILSDCKEVPMRALNSTEFSVTHRAITYTFRPDGSLMLSVPGLSIWNVSAGSRTFGAALAAPVHPAILTPLLEAMHRWAGPVETTLLLLERGVTLTGSSDTSTTLTSSTTRSRREKPRTAKPQSETTVQ